MSSLLEIITCFVTEISLEIGTKHTNAIYKQCLAHEARMNGLQVVIQPSQYVYYKTVLVGLYSCDLFMTNTSGEKAYITLNDDQDFEKFHEDDTMLIDIDFVTGAIKVIKRE